MANFQWRTGSAAELASLLRQATLERSAAAGACTIYQIMHEGQEKLAVSLPDGQVIIIETEVPSKIRRRRVDPIKDGKV